MASSLTGSDKASPCPRPLRRSGHLTLCPAHRHAVEHSFSFGPSFTLTSKLLRPRLASRSGSTPLPLRAQGEISPGKNALLRCTTAGSTPLPFGHKSFAVTCPLALVGSAFYPVLVHRPAALLHASSPHSVTLMQLRFASPAVTCLRRELHPQECAHAGRTRRKAPLHQRGFFLLILMPAIT